jgi:hypothetical protein
LNAGCILVTGALESSAIATFIQKITIWHCFAINLPNN